MGLVRPLGSMDKCVICGRDYVVTGSPQRYCPDCAPDAIRAVDTVQGLAYYYANVDQINPPRMLSRRKGSCACVICGEMYESPTRSVTCGKSECKRELRRIHQRRADAKRRLTPP
jgi:hypothetical protein